MTATSLIADEVSGALRRRPWVLCGWQVVV